MTERDEFIHEQVKDMLEPGEAVQHTAYAVKQPRLLYQMLLLGPLLTMFVTKCYWVAATDRRIILIKTKMGLKDAKMVNLGTEEVRVSDIRKMTRGGFMYNRSLKFDLTDNSELCVRIMTKYKGVSGQREFYEGWVDSINAKD